VLPSFLSNIQVIKSTKLNPPQVQQYGTSKIECILLKKNLKKYITFAIDPFIQNGSILL